MILLQDHRPISGCLRESDDKDQFLRPKYDSNELFQDVLTEDILNSTNYLEVSDNLVVFGGVSEEKRD